MTDANWNTAKLRIDMVFTTTTAKRLHAVFGHDRFGNVVAYCPIRRAVALYSHSRKFRANIPHCKHCTRVLRQAGMTWTDMED